MATTPNIDFSNTQGLITSVMCGIWLKFELIQDIMIILVKSKNEEDLIKIEGVGGVTTLKIDFSNIQGQLTPQSRVESG